MENKPLTAQSVFDQVLQIDSPADRKAYLDQACTGAPDIRQQVELLLQADAAAGSFLETPAIAPPLTIDHRSKPLLEGPGSKIGPYKLLQKLGEGGMGVVYMAEQEEPVRRRVALKIIKPGMDSHEVIARFEAERQALALMDHQNIARIYDAGMTATGRPFFVMELVHGVPITKYCDDHHLTPRERLELIIPVCHAVHHAHQKGVIHRDIKPSNVMVCLYDGKPVPKIIDFGVAKAIAQRLTERTMFTQYGAIVGSLEYMSPEQAEMSQLGVDTRSDIYLLGVLMYELLTGDTPLRRQRIREFAFDEVLRLIREEEPPKPSTRLSSSGEALATISAQRHTEPSKLTKLLRGELDWIAMKALEKDRTRRYDSASAMAKDIERFLKDEPIEACPPSTWYRLRKFARRHRTVMSVSALMIATVVVFIVLQYLQVIAANRARNVALVAREAELKAKKAAQTLADEKEKVAQELAAALVKANKATRDAEDARAAEAKEKNTAMAMANTQVIATRSAAQAYMKLKQATDELSRNLYFSSIALSERELLANNVARARLNLNKCPPEHRHWEWHYLDGLCHAELATVTPPGKILCVALSPDGQLLATGGGVYSVAGELRIWNAELGKELFNMTGHTLPVIGLAFNSDGSRLASGSLDKSIKLWDVANGNELKQITAPAEPTQVAYSPDGTRLAATLGDKSVVIWNSLTGELVRTIPNIKPLSGIAFSPDSERLAFVGPDNTLKVHHLATGGEKAINLAEHQGNFPSLAFTADGQRLIAAAYHAVILCDLNARTVVKSIPASLLNADNVFVSVDGRHLGVVEHDKSIQVWETESATKLAKLRGHNGLVQFVTFSRDGTRLASASADNTAKVWNSEQDREYRRLPISKAPSHAVAFSPDGTKLGVARSVDPQNFDFQNMGHVLLLDRKSGTEIKKFGSSLLPFTSLSFSPDGKQLAAVTNTLPRGTAEKSKALNGGAGSLYVWEIDTGKELWTFENDFGLNPQISVSSDRERPLLAIVSGYSVSGQLQIWDLKTRESIKAIPGPATCVAFNDTGNLLAAGGGEMGKPGFVHLYEASTGAELGKLTEHADAVLAVAFSCRGPEFAAGGADRHVTIYDATKRTVLQKLGPYPNQINSLAFSPDGRRLAAAGGDHVSLWDVQTGAEALILPQPPEKIAVVGIAFSPDGRTLAAADIHGSVLLWDAR